MPYVTRDPNSYNNPDFWNPRAVVARADRTGKLPGPVSPSNPPPAYPAPEYGVITIHLKELMISRGMVNGPRTQRAYRGQPSIAQLCRATGLHRDKAWQLLNHPHTIRHFSFSTIAKICKALKCQPGDFLRWQPTFTSFDQVMGLVREDTLSTKYGMGIDPESRTARDGPPI